MMIGNLRHVAGFVTLTDQMYEQARELEAAIERHHQRMESDPEYAAEWHRQQAERHDDRD